VNYKNLFDFYKRGRQVSLVVRARKVAILGKLIYNGAMERVVIIGTGRTSAACETMESVKTLTILPRPPFGCQIV
jgi:hypothetical protein